MNARGDDFYAETAFIQRLDEQRERGSLRKLAAVFTALDGAMAMRDGSLREVANRVAKTCATYRIPLVYLGRTNPAFVVERLEREGLPRAEVIANASDHSLSFRIKDGPYVPGPPPEGDLVAHLMGLGGLGAGLAAGSGHDDLPLVFGSPSAIVGVIPGNAAPEVVSACAELAEPDPSAPGWHRLRQRPDKKIRSYLGTGLQGPECILDVLKAMIPEAH